MTWELEMGHNFHGLPDGMEELIEKNTPYIPGEKDIFYLTLTLIDRAS